jgi:hypothetical protein
MANFERWNNYIKTLQEQGKIKQPKAGQRLTRRGIDTNKKRPGNRA